MLITMQKLLFYFCLLLLLISCKKNVENTKPKQKQPSVVWQSYDESADLAATQKLEQTRMHLKLVNSKVLDKNTIWSSLESDLDYFSEEQYQNLKPLVLDKDIPSIQQQIKNGNLTYEELTLFYIYRIRKYESDNTRSLNAVISLNPKVVAQAKALDKVDKSTIDIHSVFGMPILLKDNIDTKNMPTTAGAIALRDNRTDDAFITKKLKENKALILGKANLSEWAYFLCSGCPVGYSAIGGQTLNPYGRMVFESGGSSSGSGASVAANFCVAAIGTETSGSILSPSSQNSVVGLKPTIGVLSRSGIVPISSTLDTPGPMTKNVIDNAILLNAVLGKDQKDDVSIATDADFVKNLNGVTLKGKRFGVVKAFLTDSIYKVEVKNIEEVIAFNLKDSLLRIPYGQQLFTGIIADNTSQNTLKSIKENLKTVARRYFDNPIDTHQLDAILSINNYHAGYAAVAKYPALTVPMGYSKDGEPKGLTFITKEFSEAKLLQLGYAYEQFTNERNSPIKYAD